MIVASQGSNDIQQTSRQKYFCARYEKRKTLKFLFYGLLFLFEHRQSIYQDGMVEISLTDLIHSRFYACPKPVPIFLWSSFVFIVAFRRQLFALLS